MALLCGQVREWYVVSYEEIRDFPRPVTVDEEIKFAELLKVKDATRGLLVAQHCPLRKKTRCWAFGYISDLRKGVALN